MRVILFLALTGCAVDDLSDTTEALTKPMICFLDGVNGPLSDGPFTGTKPGPRDHSVGANPDGTVTALNASGEAACVDLDPALGHLIRYSSDSHATPISESYVGGANTRCFLQYVRGTGLDSGRIALTRSGNTWGYSSSYYGSSPYPTQATAVCFDINATSGWQYTLTATTDLRDYYPNGPQVPTSGVTCGLTGLTGSWVGASEGWLDRTGAYLTYDLVGNVIVDTQCFR